MSNQRIISIVPQLKIEELIKEIIHGPEKRVILELPERNPLFGNEINLRLLKFYAEEEEIEIFFQTQDPLIASLAQRLGFSTLKYSAVAITGLNEVDDPYDGELETAAAPEDWDVKQPSKRFSRLPGGLFPAVLVTVFTIGLALWWFLQPKAVLVVYPKEQKLKFQTEALIGLEYQDEDIPAGKIPAKLFDKISEITVQVVTTGRKTIGVTPATGKVTFINSTNQPVVVGKGSILTGKTGRRFLTGKNVLVPKKSTKLQDGIPVGEEYGRVELEIVAEEKGTAGNLPAKSINRIEGKFGNMLKVINAAPTLNGTDQEVAVVTLEDVKKAETEVKSQMKLSGPEEAATLVSRDYLYLSELSKMEIIKITNSPEIGSQSDTLQTHLEYRTSVLTPAQVGINKFFINQLEKNLPPNFETKNERLDLISAKVISVGENQARLNLIGQGSIRGVLEQKKIKELIKGKSLVEAKKLLSQQNEIAGFRIKSEGKALPGFGFQIKLLFPAGQGFIKK